jgi:hypothetical protein
MPEKAGRNAGTFEKGDKRINRTKPGPGRPPDVIRAALREAFWKNRKRLMEFAASKDPAIAMKAMEMIAKYGLGTPTAAVDAAGNQQDLPAIQFVQAKG